MNASFIRTVPAVLDSPDVTVQLRAHGALHSCTATDHGGGWSLALDTPATGIAPGQTAVLYDGDEVLGSATVATAA